MDLLRLPYVTPRLVIAAKGGRGTRILWEVSTWMMTLLRAGMELSIRGGDQRSKCRDLCSELPFQVILLDRADFHFVGIGCWTVVQE